jgi:hypothetical protein
MAIGNAMNQKGSWGMRLVGNNHWEFTMKQKGYCSAKSNENLHPPCMGCNSQFVVVN